MSDASEQHHGGERGEQDGEQELEAHLAVRADRARTRLSSDALERIFAASDLQLPVPSGAQHDVVARIGGASRGTRAWRVAAAIAALAGTSLLVVLFARSGSSVDQEPQSGRVIVDAGSESAGSTTLYAPATNASTAVASRAQLPEPSHFDLALSGALTAKTASQGASGAVVALHSTSSPAVAVVATSAAWDDDALDAMAMWASDEAATSTSTAIPTLTSTLTAGGDIGAITYDGLSGEMAALVAATARPR